jgi:anti-sigma factor RsiW
MATCEAFRDQALDYVYGLLDDSAAAAFRAHLPACPECQEALSEAQQQQALFAQAALAVGPAEVPAFSFPAEAAAAPAASREAPPATLPLAVAASVPSPLPRLRAVRARFWFGWAAAAAVLVAVGVTWHLYTEGHAALEEVVAQERQEVRSIETQLAALKPAFQKEAEQIDHKLLADARIHLHVTGPKQLHVAGGDVIQVAATDINGRPVPTHLTMTLVDPDTQKPLAQQKAVAADGLWSAPVAEDLAAGLNQHAAVNLVVEAQTAESKAETVLEPLRIAAPVHVAHLITNKTAYRPGELLFARALVLDRASLTPAAQPIVVRFTLTNAAGKTIAMVDGRTGAGGIATGEFAVTDQWPNGDYELRVAAQQPGVELRPHTRKLQIANNVYFNVQADRERYKAGDKAQLTFQSRMLSQLSEMKAPAPMPDVRVEIDGKAIPVNAAPAVSTPPAGSGGTGQNQGSKGKGLPGTPPLPPSAAPPIPGGAGGPGGYGGFAADPQAYFRNDVAKQLQNLELNLPKDINTSRLRVKVFLREGKQQEVFEQDLPVIPSKFEVDLFPEGGELVAGVPNRVYYRVRTPRGEPIDPEGRVILICGDEAFDSPPGEGAGFFTFTPKVGENCVVRITTPDGPTTEFTDPFARVGGIRPEGIVLHAPESVKNPGEPGEEVQRESVAGEGKPLEMVLRNSGSPRRVLLVAECRGRVVGQQWVDAKTEAVRVKLGTLAGAHGLVRVTAYEAVGGALRPMAERLVYRQPIGKLDLTAIHLGGGVITNSLDQRSVTLQFRARDEDGQPVPTWLGAAVIDQQYRTLEPSPLAYFFLAGDVKTGEDLDQAALFALDTPQARKALDLFLGTAGWRRFEPAAGKILAGAVAEGAFFGRENASTAQLQQQQQKRLEDALVPVHVAILQKRTDLKESLDAAQRRLSRAETDRAEYEARPAAYARIGLGITTLSLLGLAALALGIGAIQLIRHRQATPMFAGAVVTLGLCMLSTLALSGVPLTVGTAPVAVGKGALAADPGFFNAPQHHAEPRPTLPAGDWSVAELRAKPNSVEKESGLGALKHDRSDGVYAQLPGNALLAESTRGAGQTGVSQTASSTDKKAKANSPVMARWNNAKREQEQAGAAAAGVLGKTSEVNRSYAFHYSHGPEQDTLLWQPDLYLLSGTGQVAFDVPMSSGAYRVLLIGNTADGRLGFYEGRLEVHPEPAR